MKNFMLVSIAIVVVLVGSYIALLRIVSDGLSNERVVESTKTRVRHFGNGGKLHIEISTINETGWGGDYYNEMEYSYQPPDSDRREFVGRGRGQNNVQTHAEGERVGVTHGKTLYLRSADGDWQTIDWQYYRFPGRENQSVRSIRDRYPNRHGIFEIQFVDLALNSLTVEWRVADEVYSFDYAFRDDHSGVDLTDVRSMKRPSSPFDTEAETYWQGMETYTKWILPNSHARATGVDQQAEREKLEEHLLSIANQLNDKMGRAFIAQRKSLTQDDLEHSYIDWIREKHETN